MGKLYKNGSPISNVYTVGVNAPFDDRLTVKSLADLTDGENGGIAAQVYKGMVVYVQDENSLYIYTGSSSSTWKNSKGNLVNGGSISNWSKLIVNPADGLSYYQEKLGARILNSVDGLVGIADPFNGMLAYVKDDPNSSEDESGLYIYTGSAWKKIFTGSGTSGSGDVSNVMTFDGTVPSSGNGFSIVGNDPNAYIEETYVDNGFEAGQYYSGRGLNSTDDNGGSLEDNVDYITLTNGGESSIKLNSGDNPNWIELNIVDDSLGFTMQDVTWIDANGVEHQMESNPLVLPKETPISFGDNAVDFNGMTETRGDDPTTYVFGDTGSEYGDVDIYTAESLPTIYAYSNNEPVRVLTEGDKIEIVNMIENSSIESISNEEILGIF